MLLAKTSKAQRRSIHRKFTTNNNGHASYKAFRKTVQIGFGGDYVVVQWCGMYLAIELDGHVHS
jgi:hypothetical protein